MSTTLTLIALLFAVMAVAAWVRSYSVADGLHVRVGPRHHNLYWTSGSACYVRYIDPLSMRLPRWYTYSLPPHVACWPGGRSFAGFWYKRDDSDDRAARHCAVPFWFLALLGILPLARHAPSPWRVRTWLPGLLVLSGCVALWLRGSYTTDWWWWTLPNGDTYFVVSTLGRVRLAVQRAVPPTAPGGFSADTSWWGSLVILRDGDVFRSLVIDPWGPEHSAAGFEWTDARTPTLAQVQVDTSLPAIAAEFRCLAIPYWFITGVSALPLTAAAAGALRATRRRRRGLCPICGYDLVATPARCPECGTRFGTRAK